MATTKLSQQPSLDPNGTTIVVTGASGFIASHIINEALLLGYHVRGTARSKDKAEKTNSIFCKSHPENYDCVVVKDMVEDVGGIESAVKGVDVVIHVASDTTFSDDPKQVVDGVVKGTRNFLEASKKAGSVKRFVLTSSSTAALLPKPNTELTVTTKTWNDEAVDAAWNNKGQAIGPNSYNFIVYAASKTEGERALWKFMKDEKPDFIANSVLPNANLGRVLNSPGATGNLMIKLFSEGQRGALPPQYWIDVIDDARLHLIAGVLDEDIKNERIFAFAGPFNNNDSIDAIKRVRPDVKADLKKDPDEGRDLSKVPNELGAKLLKKWFGQDGYKNFDQSVKENLEGL